MTETMKTITDSAELKIGKSTVIDRNDDNWMAEGVLERILYPQYPIPNKWLAVNYPELNHQRYASIYPRLVLRGNDKQIYSAPMNPNWFTVRQ